MQAEWVARGLSAKNVALKERHEQLKQETEAAFREARSLQERWHSHTLPLQNEAYKVWISYIRRHVLSSFLTLPPSHSLHLINH